MRNRLLLAGLVLLIATVFGAAQAFSKPPASHRVVFVQTNEPSGNRILVYDVADGGQLSPAGSYATGGNGGVAAPGAESDHLASQGSLAYDAAHGLLFAVNAGSDSVSTFTVRGDRLELEGVVPSGGQFPNSITVHRNLVYVLNAGGTGVVQGFRIGGAALHGIPHSTRSLGLANGDPPNFLTAPGQIGFTPDGRQLLVTTKASGSTIDVFGVRPNGRLSDTFVANPSATPVPFAFTFTPTGRLAVGEAMLSDVSTYVVQPDDMLTDPKSQSDNQMALCWIQPAGQYYYVSNTASNTLSAFQIAPDGQPSLVGDGVAADTQPGPIDLTSPPGTSFLYAQTGSGTLHEYEVNGDGSLTTIGAVSDLPAGMEGIASS
jgi:6-phosphogluconolactonase (cycloisomerase 2 family)